MASRATLLINRMLIIFSTFVQAAREMKFITLFRDFHYKSQMEHLPMVFVQICNTLHTHFGIILFHNSKKMHVFFLHNFY